MATQIKEYSETESALSTLREKYHGVIFDCAKTKGMKDAKSARAKFVKLRTTLEKKRVEIKSPALKHCQDIDSESNRIKIEISELETAIDQQIKKEENRKAEIKAEEGRKGREEIQKFRDKIEAIRRRPLDYIGASPDQILEALTKARIITADIFPAELRADAFSALEGAIKKLEEMHIAALDVADKVNQLEDAQAIIESAPVAETDNEPTWPAASENSVVNDEVDWDEIDPLESSQAVAGNVFDAPNTGGLLTNQIKKSEPFGNAKVRFPSTRNSNTEQETKPSNPLLPAAKAACQYLESDPKSRDHIITRNLRAAINRVI